MSLLNVKKVNKKKAQYQYYQKIRERTESLLGSRSITLKRYEKKYDQELLTAKWQVSDKTDFFKCLKKNEIILVGDFHAQAQSTRSFLRIARKLGANQICLALESIPSEYQSILDQYIQGHLAEKDFLKKIEWKKNWGFPWEYTKPLLRWAIQNQVPVLALNSITKKKLSERDLHAAKIILKAKKLHQQRQMMVQFGDFHLAEAHLPKTLKKLNKKISLMTVLQSPEELFFKVLNQKNEYKKDISQIDFIKMGHSRWAIMSVVPWVKWQDYLLFLESGKDKKIEIDDFDMTDHVAQAVQVIGQTLQKNIDTSELSVYSVTDDQIFDQVALLPQSSRIFYKQQMISGQSFYSHELKSGFVARASVNHISRAAAQYYLYKKGLYLKTQVHFKKDFTKMIWYEMLVYFLTKIINPKRKTNTLEDIRNAIKSENFIDLGKEALVLSIEQKFNELKYVTTGLITPAKSQRKTVVNQRSYLTASQILGGMLGEKLYVAFQRKILKWPQQESFLFQNLDQLHFDKKYYEYIEIIDSWPVSMKSKFDRF